jgi:hypothetical protein
VSAARAAGRFKDHTGHRSAWTAREVRGRDDLLVPLTQDHVAALKHAVAAARRGGLATTDVTRDGFPLGAFSGPFAALKDDLLFGRGIAIISAAPIAEAPEDVERLFWGIGTHLGRAVSQSVMGDKLGRVIDVTDVDPHARAYRSKRELELHTDLSDAIAFCCVRQAPRGGLSQYASAIAIHDEMARTRPDLLEILYRGFPWHRYDEQGAGDEPITPHRVPSFSETGGQVSCRYVRNYILEAAHAAGQPLSAAEKEAITLLEAIARRKDVHVEFLLQPGDMIFINNLTVLHARSEFENDPDPARKRLLLRLWLATDGRPTVPEILLYPTGPGGGVPPQPGRVPSFALKTRGY